MGIWASAVMMMMMMMLPSLHPLLAIVPLLRKALLHILQRGKREQLNINIDTENMAMDIDINTKEMTIVMDIVSKINQYLVKVEHCCLGFLLKGLQTSFHSSVV